MRMVYVQPKPKPVILATRLLIVALLAMTMVGISPASPALGNTPVGGRVVITGTVFLPQFPAAHNTGYFNGRALLELFGHSADNPLLQWQLNASTSVTGSFLYSEPPPTPLAGSASGVLLITGNGLNILFGKHINLATGELANITYFKAEVLFFWARIGATAVITNNITLDARLGAPINSTKTLIAKLSGTGFNSSGGVQFFGGNFPAQGNGGLATANVVISELIAKR